MSQCVFYKRHPTWHWHQISGAYGNTSPNKGDTVVGSGRAKRWMTSTWNKQEFILLSFGHRSSYLVDITEHDLWGHLGVNATIVRIQSKC